MPTGSPSIIGPCGAVALVAALVGACGGRTLVEPAGDTDPPVLPPGAAPLVEDCAAPLPVPAGAAWIGGMRWHGGKLEPLGCNPPEPGYVGKRFFVPAFFLDPDEATHACYRHCVERGVCLPPHPVTSSIGHADVPPGDDPSMQLVAARDLDHDMAEAFCAWRGGRLPSMAELMRAEHGDALAVLNQSLTELWLTCASEPKLEQCEGIWSRVYSWPAPVRSWKLDRGPFGHHDLAGSAIELTLTRLPITVQEDEAFCSMPMDAVDPRSLGTSDYIGFFPICNLLVPPAEGSHVSWVVAGATDETGHAAALQGGVRCAYDPR